MTLLQMESQEYDGKETWSIDLREDIHSMYVYACMYVISKNGGVIKETNDGKHIILFMPKNTPSV